MHFNKNNQGGAMIVVVFVFLLVGSGMLMWFQYRTNQRLQDELALKKTEQATLKSQVSALNAQVAALQESTTEAEATKQNLTCTDTSLVPAAIVYSYDDPRDYLKPLFSALTTNDDGVARRFFHSTLTQTEQSGLINLDADFSDFAFEVYRWGGTEQTVGVTVTTPTETGVINLTPRKEDGCWKLLTATDEKGLLD